MTAIERVLINLSTLIVGLSGIAYAWMKYLMAPSDPFSAINHPLQPWMLDFHVLGSPLMLFGLGLIAQDHIFAQIRKGPGRPGRGTGQFALSCVLPMVATGYLFQVVTNESGRAACVAVHLATGAIYLAAFAAHLVISRRLAAAKAANGTKNTEPSR